MRVIKIDVEGYVFETDVADFEERFASSEDIVINDARKLENFTDLDGRVVVVTDASAYRYGAPVNKKATALLLPRSGRGFAPLLHGDAYVVGENMTDHGFGLTDLPEAVGLVDVIEAAG